MLVFKRDANGVVSSEMEVNDPSNAGLFKGKIIFGKYSDGTLAIDLYMFMEENDAYDGWQPYCTLSVNLPVPPAENCFYLKNFFDTEDYVDTSGIAKQFEGVLYKPMDTDTTYVSAGTLNIPEVELTDEVVASLEALNWYLSVVTPK